MPLIEVLGVPWMFPWSRRKFKRTVREAVASIPEMEVSTREVSVLTFREAGGFDGEIHIRFTFNEKEERIPEVRHTLALKVAEVVNVRFPRTKLIESWGNPFHQDNGFAWVRKEYPH